MSEQIPAGWYPDPKDITGDPRPQRWWDGTGWTASTRPAPSDAPPPESPAAGAPGPDTTAETRVLEGEVLEGGPSARYPEPPPFGTAYGSPVPPPPKVRRRPSKLVVAATVAALLGLGAGSGITYLAMDDHGDRQRSARPGFPNGPYGEGGPWRGLPDLGGPGDQGNGQGNGNGNNGNNGNGNNGNGNSGKGGNGNGGGDSKGGNGGSGDSGGQDDGTAKGRDKAVDVVNRLVLPVPSGWEGGTTRDGFAALSIGSYTCEGGGTCSLGGANSGRIAGGGTDAQAAAKADIEKAAKDSYNELVSHEELKSEAVKVDGRDGYLVRWKVDAAKGNDGYVQTVVFPSADGKTLVSVHLGFDITPKAPELSVMDTIVKGIDDYSGKLPAVPGLPGGPDGGAGTATT
ncbi:DUF2510 domain-containing protein [Kitasatospora sp. NPDC002965]|uniref:DUF2510 domain-containing protein n=1 Tax=Kitasatospora sp. NPDC002965 TaxID=3154775 RepID=UPI0033B24974